MEGATQHIRRGVVKVRARTDAPDFDQPWQRQGVDEAVGSGWIVDTPAGPRVLTNAHVIDHAVLVEARRYGDAAHYPARLERVSHDCDLALLDVEDPGFYAGAPRLELGDAPDLGDEVTVLGYPIGGERLSITRGVVSRIEMAPYLQSERRLLSMQIDAAINSGNSGGPVLQGGRVAGVAFEDLTEGQNIGYIIPASVVRHFLDDGARGEAGGFPDLGIETQRLESPAHRRMLGLDPKGGGIRVSAVAHGGTSWGHLRPGDVLMGVAGTPVAWNGSVPYHGSQRLHLSYLVTHMAVGERVELGVSREGAPLRVEVELRPAVRLIRKLRHGEAPPYFVYGGALFVPLTLDYMWSWDEGHDGVPVALRHAYWYGIRTPERREVVVLQYVLADASNQGYHHLSNRVVTRVQGAPVRDLADLVSRVEGATSDFLVLETHAGEEVVLDRAAVAARGPAVLEGYGVTRDRSPDLVR